MEKRPQSGARPARHPCWTAQPRRVRKGAVFFFQAEDGIRDVAVTGVQTCALPIWNGLSAEGQQGNVHLGHPTPEALLLVVRERGMPLGRLAILAHRATAMARRWLERDRKSVV